MDILMEECLHGIPLVNGKGCMICSNRNPSNTVYVNLDRGTRETRINQALKALGDDAVIELSAEQFI